MSEWTQAQVDAHNRRIAHGRGEASTAIQEDAIGAGEEEKLHKQIINYCKAKRWLYVHSRPDVATGRTPGEPDFSIFANGGRRFDIECKTRTGKLSPEQLGFIEWAKSLGHTVHVVRSFSGFVKIVEFGAVFFEP
jgi:hypothetical protein